MNLEKRNADAMASQMLTGAGIALTSNLLENMRTIGVYDAVNRAPVSHLMNEYIELRDARELEFNKGQNRNWGLIDKLEKDLLAIPQEIVWKQRAPNLVTTVGKNDLLDKYLAGSAYTAAWYMLLVSLTSYTSGPAAGDTSASHSGWTESTVYAAATRPSPAWSTAASGSKSTSAGVSFSINGSDTIKGCGLISNNSKAGNTGILLSVGTFVGGDQPVANSNTLSVTYSLSV